MRRTSLVSLALIALGSQAQAQGRGEVAPTWTLVEDLRIGEDDGMKQFSDIRSIVATKNGNIFVLDFKARQVRVFDAKGNFLRLAARDGAGPGEIRNANGLAVGDNDLVWVNDPSNARFSIYNSDGSFAKQVLAQSWGYGYVWGGVVDGKGRAIEFISVTRASDKREGAIRVVSETGTADTLPVHSCPGSAAPPDPPVFRFQAGNGDGYRIMSIPFLPAPQLKLTPSGNAWCSPAGEYRLWVGQVGAANKEVVSLKVDPVPVTAAERQREVNRIDSIVRSYGPLRQGDLSQIPKTKPIIASTLVDDASRVWVRLTASPDTAPVYDVFDTKGNMIARARGKGRINSYVATISGGYLYTSQLDENDVPTVVRYRIQK
jgi:hypothetical protein